MVPSLRRRQLLGAAVATVSATLAGCGGHGPSLEMREASDTDLRSGAARTIDADATSDRLQPIADTIDDGTSELSWPSPEPRLTPARPVVRSRIERPIEYEGAYYTLALTETVEGTLIDAEIRVGTAETPSGDDANAIAYGALPEVDSAALDGALAPDTGDEGDETVQLYYTERDADASTLVPEPEYDAVVRDDRRYSIELATAEETPGYTYRYRAERVASTDDEFLAWLRSEYRYELTALSGDEREIVAEAIEEGRYAGGESEDAFSSLAERFLSRPALEREDGAGEWFVRYDGTEYVAELTAPPEFH